MKATWFTYAMDGNDPEEFDTKKAAVAHAQSVIGTERRPKRLEFGIYFIAGERGYSRYIGTPEMFERCGYAWATARMNVDSASSMRVRA